MWKIETERADLFDVNMMISMEVKATGEFIQDEIVEAFNNAVKLFEILNTKVFIDNDGNAYYKENDKNNNKVWFSPKTLNELINEQEKIRFHIEKGEFLRLFVSLNNTENRFVFMLHHLGGDGKSLLYFIEAFFKSLNNESLEFNKISVLNKDTLPQNSKMPLVANAFINYFNKKWQKEKKFFSFEDMDKAFNDYWKNHKTNVEIQIIGQKELSEELKECKDNGIGYTSYFIANKIKNIEKIQDIGLAVDGREDKNRTMSNQATGISIKYKYDNRKSIVDNAKRINSLMRKKLNNLKYKYFILHFMATFDSTLVDAINLEHANYFHSKTSEKLAEMLGYGSKTKDLSVTNLTKVDIPIQYGNYKIDEITFVPPVVSYGKNIIGMITTNDKLIVTTHYYDN